MESLRFIEFAMNFPLSPRRKAGPRCRGPPAPGAQRGRERGGQVCPCKLLPGSWKIRLEISESFKNLTLGTLSRS